MNISDLFRRQAAARPAMTAYICGGKALTWREVDARSDGLAAAFVERLIAGDRVAILALNCHRYWETHAACAKAGVIAVPINHRLTEGEISYILNHVGAAALVVDDRVPSAEAIAQRFIELFTISFMGSLAESTAYEDLAIGEDRQKPDRPYPVNAIGFTSGTTGRPRGAILTQHTATTSALWFASNLGLGPESTFLACMPAYVNRGQAASMAPVVVGATTIPMIFNATSVLDAIEIHRVTHVILAPPMVDRLLTHPGSRHRDFSSLESVWLGGAPSAPVMIERLHDLVNCEIGSTYGMTEATGIASIRWSLEGSAEETLRELSSVGRTGPLLDVRLIGKDGNEVAAGTVGEITVRGDSLMEGYWAVSSEECFVNGWYPTGDMATRDWDGRLYLVDRRVDVIVSGGLNVYASEVEQALGTHPGVEQCAVVSGPDDQWGETVVAAVVVRTGHEVTVEALSAHCAPLLAGYKHPKRLVLLEELPSNAMGKIDRRAVREAVWSGQDRRIG
jgi:acyl-CoA synthetase (AMP-forming)/AMP-acid ligase II